jgi:hypothetical protein
MPQTKFQSYRSEPDKLIQLIEGLPTATDKGKAGAIGELQKIFDETLSRRDPQTGKIINHFPVPQKPDELIKFTKEYISREYGKKVYCDHLKEYIDTFWDEISKTMGGWGTYRFLVSPLEELAEKFDVDVTMAGTAGPEYERLKAMKGKLKNGGLSAEDAKEIAEKFVAEIEGLEESTKRFLVDEYLIKNKDAGTADFYANELAYHMVSLASKHPDDFKGYTADIGKQVWDSGKGTGYDKFKALAETTERIETAYNKTMQKAQA